MAIQIQTTSGLYQGNQPKPTIALQEWHARQISEPALEPTLLIIDPHHHLYDTGVGSHYLLPDLLADINGGHNIAATVYVEAYSSMWRATGAKEMRPVGEVEFACGVSAVAASRIYGSCQVAAAIVAHADLTLGDGVAAVLEEELQAGRGRLRGVRYQAAYNDGLVGSYIKHKAPKHMLADSKFKKGFAHLSRFGLSFDAWLLHTQLEDLIELAESFPNTTIVLNHLGGVIGVAEFYGRRELIFAQWRTSLAKLARCENVVVKIGGMGMPLFGFGFEQHENPARSLSLMQAWKPYIDVCIDLFGPSRCMFESNFPVDKQSCGYNELWNAFKLATTSYSIEERKNLFSGTASRVYEIPLPP